MAAALMLSACADNPQHLQTHYLDAYGEASPALDEFYECHGFNCSRRTPVSLTPGEWRAVTAIFAARAKDAKAERQQIARALVQMRRLVGAKTGTAVHQWTHHDRLVLPNLGDPTQLDCIDEAVNTNTYLTMMEQAKLFRFHKVAPLSYAGSVTDPNPRNTAVVQEIGGEYFAIDPSVVDFGQLPAIFPLTVWLGSWPPDLATSETQGKAAARG